MEKISDSIKDILDDNNISYFVDSHNPGIDPPDLDSYWEYSYDYYKRPNAINICNISDSVMEKIEEEILKRQESIENYIGRKIRVISNGTFEDPYGNYVIIQLVNGR